MASEIIKTYAFNAHSRRHIEVKPLSFLWDKRELASAIHRTEFYHLIWVEEGSFRLMLDFEELCLKAGQGLLIFPGQVCRFALEGAVPRAYSTLFVAEFLGDMPADRGLLHRIFVANLLGQRVASLDNPANTMIYGELLRALQGEGQEFGELIVASYLRILLAELAHKSLGDMGKTNSLALRFFDLVESHYRELYNVADYLPLLGVQDKALAQSVRLALGLSPKAYIDQRRMLEAKRYLSHSELSIKEISFRLGFDEPTNFNKFFRKHSSLSPGAFRDKQKLTK